jgi:hypothetical protein
MLILKFTLLLAGLEALLSWCWLVTPAELELFVLAHLSIAGGVAVAACLKHGPTYPSTCVPSASLIVLPAPAADAARKAA